MATISNLAPMLKTDNMGATVVFYCQILGFKVIGFYPKDNPCWIALKRDDVELMFTTNNELHLAPPHTPAPTQPILTGRLYIRTDDVMAIYNDIKDKVKIIEGPEVYFYGMKEIAFRDNNGYVITIGQDTDEPATHPHEDH